MKKWNKPEVEVLGVEETQYGSKTPTVSDGTYVDDATGKKFYGWASGNTNENGGLQ